MSRRSQEASRPRRRARRRPRRSQMSQASNRSPLDCSGLTCSEFPLTGRFATSTSPSPMTPRSSLTPTRSSASWSVRTGRSAKDPTESGWRADTPRPKCRSRTACSRSRSSSRWSRRSNGTMIARPSATARPPSRPRLPCHPPSSPLPSRRRHRRLVKRTASWQPPPWNCWLHRLPTCPIRAPSTQPPSTSTRTPSR